MKQYPAQSLHPRFGEHGYGEIHLLSFASCSIRILISASSSGVARLDANACMTSREVDPLNALFKNTVNSCCWVSASLYLA
jgi:hypothetical protein